MLQSDGVFKMIGTMLDGCSTRHKVIAANIANVETPGYKALEVKFEDQLAKMIDQKDLQDVDQVDFQISEKEGLAERANGNNVDFGSELSDMTRNNLMYSTFAQLAALRVRRYREAMGG